jgi:serine/threonine protein kinase
MEYAKHGDLKSFLQTRSMHNAPVSIPWLMRFCNDISQGLLFLAYKQCVHRDLSCRNCLVFEEDFTVKIADFGMSRDVHYMEYYRKDGEVTLPVRWIAPECVVEGIFSTQGDIWSIGIVIWEIFSHGKHVDLHVFVCLCFYMQIKACLIVLTVLFLMSMPTTLSGKLPYPSMSNHEVLEQVIQGYRLECPQDCPDDVYQLMRQCWSTPRPRCAEICEFFEKRQPSPETMLEDLSLFDTAGLNTSREVIPTSHESSTPVAARSSPVEMNTIHANDVKSESSPPHDDVHVDMPDFFELQNIHHVKRLNGQSHSSVSLRSTASTHAAIHDSVPLAHIPSSSSSSFLVSASLEDASTPPTPPVIMGTVSTQSALQPNVSRKFFLDRSSKDPYAKLRVVTTVNDVSETESAI